MRLALVLLAAGTGILAQDVWPVGRHALVLECPGGPLPFGFVLESEDGRLRGFIENPPERIEVPRVTWEGDIVLDFAHYDSRVVLTVDESARRLHGTWTKVRGPDRTSRMKVRTATSSRRFPVARRDRDPSWINGRWAVRFASDKDPAVGVFAASTTFPYPATGTFVTTLGDYRYLAGNVDGDVARLSCFDGAHAFLFESNHDHNRRESGGKSRACRAARA